MRGEQVLTPIRREQERVRMAAAAMFEKGLRQKDVVEELGVSKASASYWYRRWKEGGKEALRARQALGPPRRLSPEQLEELEKELLQGPRAHGYATELWTLSRIAQLIEKRFGIRYHPSHVFKVLRAMNWTSQKPARQAKERDEEAIRRWREERWPTIKKGHSGRGG